MKFNYVVEVYTFDTWYTCRFINLMDALIFYNDVFKKGLAELKSISIYYISEDGEKSPVEVVDILDIEEDLPF